MKMLLYPKLAVTGIIKNRRLYVPYLLSCIGMVLMFYIIQSISYSPLLTVMEGGTSMALILTLGKFVIAVFSLIFLLYTNSFLIRRRNKEFGLYNILGMDKKSICRITAWESLMTAVCSLFFGILFGIAFSKIAELGLLNAIRSEIDYSFTVTGEAILMTALIYGAIFVLLFIKSILQVSVTNPIELVKSENSGEKPPKANRLLAVLGILMLGGAYWLSVSIQDPMTAIVIFFAAVLLVIFATYLLFISGSVALCKGLQNNKKYYYKKEHFVSVSSMAYRMKRNGAGLASVCILSTMVLVMLSSTGGLLFGEENALRVRYPNDSTFTVGLKPEHYWDDAAYAEIDGALTGVFEEYGAVPKSKTVYTFAKFYAVAEQGKLNLYTGTYENTPGNACCISLVSTADYNRVTGENLTLSEGETAIMPMQCTVTSERFTIGDTDLTVVPTPVSFPANTDFANQLLPSMMFIVNDISIAAPYTGILREDGETAMTVARYYAYDLAESEETALSIYNGQYDAVTALPAELFESYIGENIAEGRTDFFNTYGGLFFIGIILSIVFVFAAAMIIYYKQVSEGYEDRARFAIMQKIGMTKEDIKKSIDSQVLIVFFAPLVLAGIHLAFAFPIVWKILQIFHLRNKGLFILTNVGAFVFFAAVYAVIYKITAGTYNKIVSCKEE